MRLLSILLLTILTTTGSRPGARKHAHRQHQAQHSAAHDGDRPLARTLPLAGQQAVDRATDNYRRQEERPSDDRSEVAELHGREAVTENAAEPQHTHTDGHCPVIPACVPAQFAEIAVLIHDTEAIKNAGNKTCI